MNTLSIKAAPKSIALGNFVQSDLGDLFIVSEALGVLKYQLVSIVSGAMNGAYADLGSLSQAILRDSHLTILGDVTAVLTKD